MTIPLIAIGLFAATAIGGALGIKFRGHLRQILGLTAGLMLGVVAFDLLPEIFAEVTELDLNPYWPMIGLVAGFLGFHIVEKLVFPHHAHHDDHDLHGRENLGALSALALSAHSFIDGIGVGLAFQINPGVGLAVALAVFAHNFSDGLNTVSLMLANGNSVKRTVKYLLIDAVAPALGILTTLFFTLPESWLVVYLGFFAGFLLYVSASSILPEAHREHTSKAALAFTILGAAIMYTVSYYALG